MKNNSFHDNSVLLPQKCRVCSSDFGKLIGKINILKRENQNLAFMLDFKNAALKNREELIGKIVSQNQTLKEENRFLKQKLSESLENLNYKKKNPNESFLSNTGSIKPKEKEFASRFIPKINNKRSSSSEHSSLNSLYKRNNESLHIRKITQFSGVVTVTETQGMSQLHSLVNNNNREGRKSLLANEGVKQTDQNGLKKLEKWIFSIEGLKIGVDIKEQIELQENLKCFFCDFKRMVKNCANLKKMIKSIFSIVETLDLEQNTQKILQEIHDSLSSERESLFFLDELHDGLIPFDFQNKRNNSRIPISKGISNYVVNTGKILKIDDPYSDSRFSKEIDAKHNIKTKNLICSPIKDTQGKIFAIVQVINKTTGVFSQDDAGVLDLLAGISGLCLKNCLMYDSIVLNERKLYRLMEIITILSLETDLKRFLKESKIYLSQLIATEIEQTQVFLYESLDKKLITFKNDSLVKISQITGIIGFVLEHKNLYETFETKKDEHYNPVIDLITEVPLLTVPILDEDQNVLGVFQVTNLRSYAERNLGKTKWANYDLITLFANFLACSFKNILERNKKTMNELIFEDLNNLS